MCVVERRPLGVKGTLREPTLINLYRIKPRGLGLLKGDRIRRVVTTVEVGGDRKCGEGLFPSVINDTDGVDSLECRPRYFSRDQETKPSSCLPS